jgi:hypothetical protein
MEAARPLPRETWSSYFDSITVDLHNEPVSIEILDSSSPPRFAATRLALQTLTYDRRKDVFEVAAALGGPRLPSVLRHLVDHPTRIEVDSWTSLAPSTIAIEGGDGVRTVVRVWREGAFSG